MDQSGDPGSGKEGVIGSGFCPASPAGPARFNRTLRRKRVHQDSSNLTGSPDTPVPTGKLMEPRKKEGAYPGSHDFFKVIQVW
jgi:hypothetical protein